jgi:cytochrome c-type biogenesis protein CcmE
MTMDEHPERAEIAVRRSPRWRGAGFLGVGAVLAGFGYLLYGGIGENLVFYLTPSELEARGEAAWETSVRLGGVVIPESVRWDADALDLRFVVGDGTTEMEVHSRGAPPQMFRDGIEVLVEGRLASDGIFRSTNLMVKHSNEYRAPEEGQRPQDLYRDLLAPEGG